jgi:endonuclease/exonuclease/phosphatase (EEP) superfamily protein YafD
MCNAEALANLATAVSADREAFAKLTALVEQLQAENQSLKENNKENRKNGTGHSQKQPNNRECGYCWTHGFRVAHNHNSRQTCRAKADGHKDDATKENTIGGSTMPIDEVRRWQV